MSTIKAWLKLFFVDFRQAWFHSLIYGGAIGLLFLFAVSLLPLGMLCGLLDFIWDGCILFAVQEKPFMVWCVLVLYSVLHCYVAWYVEHDSINQPKQKEKQNVAYPYMEFTMLELDMLVWMIVLIFSWYILIPLV